MGGRPGHLLADFDNEAESSQKLHGGVVRCGAAVIHKYLRGTVKVGMADVRGHGQLPKPVEKKPRCFEGLRSIHL